MLICVFVSFGRAQNYPEGIISYWRFNHTLLDELGNYNAVMGPSGSFAIGKIDLGLRGFRTCSSQVAAKAYNFPNLESFTVEAWINPSCNSWQASLTVAKWASGYAGPGFVLASLPRPYGSGTYEFYFIIRDQTNYKIIESPTIYACNDWYHVVGIRDKGNVIKLYVNGQEVASEVDNIGSIANTQPLTFHGALQSMCDWGMSEITLDEVAIYDRVLSADEIQCHYENGLEGKGYDEACFMEVIADIKPGSCPNPLNLKGKGVFPVAVLGTEDFDVTEIDPASIQLTLEGIEGGVSPLRAALEDVATPFEGEECECHDMNGDGYLDLTLKFDMQSLVEALSLGDVAGETIPLILTGELKEEHGGTPIRGSDCVRIK